MKHKLHHYFKNNQMVVCRLTFPRNAYDEIERLETTIQNLDRLEQSDIDAIMISHENCGRKTFEEVIKQQRQKNSSKLMGIQVPIAEHKTIFRTASHAYQADFLYLKPIANRFSKIYYEQEYGQELADYHRRYPIYLIGGYKDDEFDENFIRLGASRSQALIASPRTIEHLKHIRALLIDKPLIIDLESPKTKITDNLLFSADSYLIGGSKFQDKDGLYDIKKINDFSAHAKSLVKSKKQIG